MVERSRVRREDPEDERARAQSLTLLPLLESAALGGFPALRESPYSVVSRETFMLRSAVSNYSLTARIPWPDSRGRQVSNARPASLPPPPPSSQPKVSTGQRPRRLQKPPARVRR